MASACGWERDWRASFGHVHLETEAAAAQGCNSCIIVLPDESGDRRNRRLKLCLGSYVDPVAASVILAEAVVHQRFCQAILSP
jgi:hypothetical protein